MCKCVSWLSLWGHPMGRSIRPPLACCSPPAASYHWDVLHQKTVSLAAAKILMPEVGLNRLAKPSKWFHSALTFQLDLKLAFSKMNVGGTKARNSGSELWERGEKDGVGVNATFTVKEEQIKNWMYWLVDTFHYTTKWLWKMFNLTRES